jgi:CheY-like chemotaxis protein
MAPKILVADDQLHMLRFMREQLEPEGYQLLQAHDGHEAIETTLRELPDLVLLDLIMPKLDGLAALRQLRREKSTRSIPVIVLTSSSHERMHQEAEFSGANVIMTKPFSPMLLRREIRRLVSGRQTGAHPA